MISSPWRDMSSIDFTNLSDASETCTGIVDGIPTNVVSYVVLTHVIGTTSSGIMVVRTQKCPFFTIYFSHSTLSFPC
jgi:hypothetical protein